MGKDKAPHIRGKTKFNIGIMATGILALSLGAVLMSPQRAMSMEQETRPGQGHCTAASAPYCECTKKHPGWTVRHSCASGSSCYVDTDDDGNAIIASSCIGHLWAKKPGSEKRELNERNLVSCYVDKVTYYCKHKSCKHKDAISFTEGTTTKHIFAKENQVVTNKGNSADAKTSSSTYAFFDRGVGGNGSDKTVNYINKMLFFRF